MATKSSTPDASGPSEKPIFTEKEQRLLQIAWLCLKGDAIPEVDLDKLTVLGGFNTKKTASNTWGSIKKTMNEQRAANGAGDGGGTPSTPSKPKATPKKRRKMELKSDGEDDVME